MLQINAITPGLYKLLKSLMARPELNDFALAGGTGLALQIGHRISVDLDLFSSMDFEPEMLLSQLKEDFTIELYNTSRNTLNTQINTIKVDILAYKYPLLNSMILEENIRIYSIEDIAAMKLSAISSRGSKKDFYDIYFLLKKYSLMELLDFYKRKFETNQYYHIIKSLLFFEDAEADPDPKIVEQRITWSEIKKDLEKKIKQYLEKY